MNDRHSLWGKLLASMIRLRMNVTYIKLWANLDKHETATITLHFSKGEQISKQPLNQLQ